jgi:chromate transporter
MRRDLVETRGWVSDAEFAEGMAIATACPGPLAYQLGIYCGYIRQAIPGAITVAVSFALAPFLIVVAGAALYQRFAPDWQLRALFYGIGPVVVALITRACWNLGVKTIGKDGLALCVALVACIVTLIVQRELTVLFLIAGIVGTFIFAHTMVQPEAPQPARHVPPTLRSVNLLPFLIVLASGATAAKLFLFFFKTGFLVFGSGLVIVPFLKTYLVNQYGWLNERQFLDAVAVGLITPGPVVITATFVGYVLGGFVGALAATVGIFLPSLLLTVIGTPLLRRYRSNARVQGFVRGVTVAVVGVLVGTSYLVGKAAIGDWLTLAIGVSALLASGRFKWLPDPGLVAAGAALGLLAYPLMNPAWVMR